MKIGILKKGDKVIGVTADYIAVQRKNGEADIIPIVRDGQGFRIDEEGIITIGFGENVVEQVIGDVKMITF